MPRRNERAPKPAIAEAQGGAADSIEARRFALARKLAIFASDWRRCPRRVCRRKRRCVPVGADCASLPREAPPTTPEQRARVMAELKRALDRRLGQGR